MPPTRRALSTLLAPLIAIIQATTTTACEAYPDGPPPNWRTKTEADARRGSVVEWHDLRLEVADIRDGMPGNECSHWIGREPPTVPPGESLVWFCIMIDLTLTPLAGEFFLMAHARYSFTDDRCPRIDFTEPRTKPQSDTPGGGRASFRMVAGHERELHIAITKNPFDKRAIPEGIDCTLELHVNYSERDQIVLQFPSYPRPF